MSVYIESIQIQKLGPLDSIQFNLGSLNLIYGPNESGKTYLVEFLLQSIFRHAKKWDLRDINVEGSVNIKGLGEQIAEFSPSSSKKIEDYWVQNNSGLPLNMARLLIVKGGELALSSGSPGGVNRDVLKNALTSQALLDTIQEKIQPTIRNAEIIDQKIIGKKQGQLKDHNNLQDDLKDIDSLLEEIELNYSLGPARQINIQINDIKEQIKLQNKAKRHLGFLLSKEYQELLEKRNELSNDKFLSLRDRVRDHNKLKTDRELLTKKINSVQADIDVYHWLESAQLVWEEKGLETKALPNIMLGASGGILLCAGLALVIMQNIISRPDLFWPGVITATLGALVLVFYVIRLLKWSSVSDESDERESIQDSYKEKFGQSLNGITDLKTQQNKLLEI